MEVLLNRFKIAAILDIAHTKYIDNFQIERNPN